MFTHLDKFNHILVTGPQRSGTRIAAKMISLDTGHYYVDEDDYKVGEGKFLKILQRNIKMVVQCPAMFHFLPEVADSDTLVVMMMRNTDDIAASQVRVGWIGGAYLEFKKLGIGGLQARKIRQQGGRVSELKYKRWEEIKNEVPHYLELEYESLSEHSLWIDKEKRVDFGKKQTRLEDS